MPVTTNEPPVLAVNAWVRHAWDGFPRELWNGSKFDKWTVVGGQEDYLAYCRRQFETKSPIHTSINIAGAPDSGYGVYWVDKVLLELDGPTREASYEQMQRLTSFLKINFEADPRVYFSGNRSFHLFVDFLPLALEHPEETLRDFGTRLVRVLNIDLDFQVFARRHLSRLPWSVHEKTGGLCLPVDPFSALKDVSRPECAAEIEVRYSERVRAALRRIDEELSAGTKPNVSKAQMGRAGNYLWIEDILQHPISDGRHRVLWHVLAPYLMNVRKMEMQAAEQLLREYFEKCAAAKALDPSKFTFLREIRNYLRVASKDGYGPWRLATIQAKDPGLYQIIQNEVLGNRRSSA